VKPRLSNKTFYTNLLGSGALARASEPNPILPMRRQKRLRSYLKLLAILLVFGTLIVLGFSYGAGLR
jgi:hypothetical protein